MEPIPFPQRTPSTGWEPCLWNSQGQPVGFAWFRPANDPHSIQLHLPAAVAWDPALQPYLTLRNLAGMVGLPLELLSGWTLQGARYDLATGGGIWIDQYLPATGSDFALSLWTHDSAMVQMIPTSNYPISPPPSQIQGDPAEAFAAIEASWQSILMLEGQIISVRNQLEQAAGRINSLNRDLNLDEGRVADNQDKQDWRDARRWLREAAVTLSRAVKEIDMGTVSSAGQRNTYVDLYKQFIEPRVVFPGLMESVARFDFHRKTVQQVLSGAQATLSKAGREAEQRAQQTLRRIAEKVRQMKHKR